MDAHSSGGAGSGSWYPAKPGEIRGEAFQRGEIRGPRIVETDGEIQISMEIPGLARDDIETRVRVRFADGVLTVSLTKAEHGRYLGYEPMDEAGSDLVYAEGLGPTGFGSTGEAGSGLGSGTGYASGLGSTGLGTTGGSSGLGTTGGSSGLGTTGGSSGLGTTGGSSGAGTGTGYASGLGSTGSGGLSGNFGSAGASGSTSSGLGGGSLGSGSGPAEFRGFPGDPTTPPPDDEDTGAGG